MHVLDRIASNSKTRMNMNFFPFLLSFDDFNYEFVLEAFFLFLPYLMSNEVLHCIGGRLNKFATLEKGWAMVNHGLSQDHGFKAQT